MQALRDVDLSSNLVAPQDGNDHENVATALVTQANSTLVNGPEDNKRFGERV
jgi:hypothetical protein